MVSRRITTIALARETESPENPGALERRVALIPRDVGALVRHGCEVFFERGAGDGVGFADTEYEAVGAQPQDNIEIYQKKDMVIKFKGPALNKVRQMDRGTILFCMAHLFLIENIYRIIIAYEYSSLYIILTYHNLSILYFFIKVMLNKTERIR